MALNLDQTQLTYVSLGRQTFDLKDLIAVPIKGVDNKRQIYSFCIRLLFTYSTHL